MLLSSNELDMLILQHGKDGTSADSKYIWVKYAQDKNGTDLTDDPTNAVYIGIAYNKTEKHESDNPNDYTWTRIKGNDGESAYTVILQNENITFSVSNQNNIALMDQSFDTSVVVFKGTDAVSNFTIGTVESKNGISVIQKNNTITFSVEAGNKIEADYGKFSIPISVNGLVFKKEVSWSLAKAGAVGGQGNPGEPALSISLGNESQNIPCTYDGHVINDMLIEISFVGYRGLTRTPCNVAVGTLPSGMTLGSTENCTISNDGSIILNIVKNATLGTELTLTGNIVLTFSINGKTLVKNFTWTKSKDGGLSYIYSIEPSSYVINKTYDGTLSPASITFNAYYQKDGSDRIPYHGLFTIEESTTGSDFKSTYLSSKNESSLTYTPTSNNIKSVRCTLSQTDKVSVVLDRQTVIVLSDDKMKDALTTVTTRVNGVSSKVDGIDKKITNKVWQTDITTAVNNYDGTTVKSLRDQVSSQETKIGEITSEVSDVKTTVKNNQASVQKDIASIKQDATGFKQTVASTYETKNDATSKYSSFDQRAGKIETNVKTLQGNVTTLSQTDTEIKAELKTAKGDITTLKSDASGLSTKITNAQGDVNILKADAKTMKSDISDAKGNISELQRTSTNLQSQITNNNTNINILSRDPMNYSQLKEDTADYFGFTYDNTADGKWYTVKTLSRDKFISGYYECMGGESFNIEFEISTSVKGNSTNEGTDSTYKGTAIGLYGFNAQKQSVGINYSARTTATAAATATKISSVVSVPVNSRYFRVFLQTESWGNFSGTLKIRNVIVSRIKAMETRISSAETAIQQNTNDISLRATNVQLDQVKKEINGNFANYSTTTEMNSAINQAANSITLDVSKKYTEKTVYDQGIADAKKDATTKADNALNSAKADATSKANKAESNAKADTANKLKNYSTTTEMNSAIKVKADSITQEVSKTYTKQTDFNSLYIGGRNLARNTSSSYSSEFSGFSGAANIRPSVATVLTDGLAAGDEITIHLYYNYSNIVAATGQTAKVWIQGSGNVTGWSSGVFPSSPSIAISGSGTKEFLYTTTVSEDQIKNSYWLVNLRHDYVQSGTVRWKMFKVEKGNRHSEWSPAPEDTSAAITKVEQTATGIRADLSNTQGDISSLQATASGLQKSISNAQGDINTMKSDATKIKTRISNAEGDISTLQQTANGFQVQLSKKADQVDSFNWNLVPNSYKMNNQWSAAGGFVGTTTVVLDPDALCGYHIEVKCTTAGSGPHYPVFGKTSDKVGKTYTWSFWAKCSANKSSVPVGHECGGIKRIDLTTSWQKYFMTWKYIDAAHSSFTFYATFAVGEILYIRDFKIEEGSIATKWAPAESDLKGEKGAKGDKGDTGGTGATGKGVKSIVEQYYKSTSATAMSGGSWSTTYPGWENSKYIWTRSVITYTDNTTSTTTAVCVTGSKGDKGEKGEKGEADIKCYPLTGGTNQLVWSKLGTLISAGNNSNFIINIYTGNGYNGHAQQNSQAEIVIKDGWQASASTTSAFGVSVTRQNCDDLKVQVRATASNKCDVWVYLPWAYSWGTYTIAGKYTSWETSSTTQTTEPITGTLQDLAYRMNSENAAKTATNFMEFTSGNGLQIGNKTDGSWSGYRTKISASAFEIINQAGITLAYYGDKLIQLGKNTKDSVIELCGGLGKIQSKQYYGYQACEMSSDYVALRSTHQAVLTSSTSTGNCMVSAAENTFGATATTTDSTGKTTKQGDIDISDGVVEFSSIRNGYDCAVGVYAGGWSGGTYRGSFSPSKGYTEKVLLGDNGAGQLWDRLMAKNATQIMSDRKAKYDIKPLGADTESQIATMSLDSEHSNANPVDIHSELFDRLQPVQYKMVNDDQRIRFGFVAQDVVDAMKELGIREDELDLVHHDQRVTENGYNDTYGMVYTNLIALITHELQLEKQRRSNLELEVADLRSELETMRDNLSGNTN